LAQDGDWVASESAQNLVARGEAVKNIVVSFDLENKYRDFIADCLAHPDDCFFVFSAMSDYDGISFTPLNLYPDVSPENENYGQINTATILGLVHGYLNEQSTPFRPNTRISRIEALKIVLGAAEKITWKEKFELASETPDSAQNAIPFSDVDPQNPEMWWYPRYLECAIESGVIDPGQYFRPDENITKEELNDMISRAVNSNRNA
jgi:hypothetical protein